MKTYWFFLLVGLIIVTGNTGCSKNKSCNPKTPQSEQSQILTFAGNNGINATAHSSGLYYEITNLGSGAVPTINSKIYIKYTGKLTNGNIFDSQSDASKTGWILGNLIQGWQIGLPLIKKGGAIKLIIPSSMGYGCLATGPIPANSILYFEIELIDVQ